MAVDLDNSIYQWATTVGQREMDYFDKRMALDVIEDALTQLGAPEHCGFAIGLCGGFYLCGLLNEAEWEEFLHRIPGAGRPGFGDFWRRGCRAQ